MAGEEHKSRPPAGTPGDETELMGRLEEEIRNMSVAEHLTYMLHSLSALAVSRLGLAPDAGVRSDPAQARLAIEAFKALVGVLEQVRPANEIATHRGMLAQLQLAYAGAVSPAAPREELEETEQAIDTPAVAEAETPADDAASKPRRSKRSGQTGA